MQGAVGEVDERGADCGAGGDCIGCRARHSGDVGSCDTKGKGAREHDIDRGWSAAAVCKGGGGEPGDCRT